MSFAHRPSQRGWNLNLVAAIADVLGLHGALSAAEFADHIRATDRGINNRAVFFSLQALKKRGRQVGAPQGPLSASSRHCHIEQVEAVIDRGEARLGIGTA